MKLKQALAAANACACALLLSACASAPQPSKSGDAAPQRAASLVARDSGAATGKTDKTDKTDNEAVVSPLPNPTGHVNDFAGVLDDGPQARLEEKLARLKERLKVEVGVAIVETTGERDINEYSLAVARGWGVGPPKGEEGGGILLLLAVKDRKWHVQVSRSLEQDLPNEVVAEVGGRMNPLLQLGEYADAVEACVDGLVKRLEEKRGR